MADKIEILENTITKLLIRRGTDAQRKNVTLSLGEPGYTTDSKRLFVGDGETAGGIVAGNKYQGESTSPTAFTTAITGDICFATRNSSNLYNTTLIYVSGSPSDATSWKPVVPLAATPRAWVIFDGSGTSGTATVFDSYNVSSVTTLGVGNFQVNFSYTLPTSNYAVITNSSGYKSSLKVQTVSDDDDGNVFGYKTYDSVVLVNTTPTTTRAGELTGTKQASVFIYYS